MSVGTLRTRASLVAGFVLLSSLTLVSPGFGQDPAIGEVSLFGEEEFTIQAATKTEIPISKAPGSVTVIGAKQIRQSGARTIPEILRLVAGVNVRWNPMVQTIDMRSFGSNPFTSRVLLLIDGVPYNSWNKGGFPQHPGFDFFSIQHIKRIEVLRGPGSALYGENAYWGVINIVTLSGKDFQGGKLEFYGGDLEASSVAATYGQKLGEDGSILVSGKWAEGQFPTTLWFEDNDSLVQATSVYLKANYKGFEASYYRHSDEADGYREELPVPGTDLTGALYSADTIAQDVDIFALKYKQDFGANDRFTFGGDISYATRNGSHCGTCHAAPQSFEEFGSGKKVDHGHQLIGDFRIGINGLGPHSLLFGIEARDIDTARHAAELGGSHSTAPILSYSKVAGYVQDQISLANDKLNLTIGARYDGSNDLFDDEVSPRISAVYSVNDALVLRGGWARAFRFPNFSELYQASWFFALDAGAFVAPLAIFTPNPELQPEQIETFDLGLQYRVNPDLSVRLDAFRSRVEDFIVQAWVPQPPPNPFLLRMENQTAAATLTGAELEFRWSGSDAINGFFNVAYQDTDRSSDALDSAGTPLELVYAPELKFNSGFYFGPFNGISGSVELQWRDERYYPGFWNFIINSNPELGVVDGYTLLHARLSYDLPVRTRPGQQPPRFNLYGRNLLDEAFQETVNGVGSFREGRTIYGSFEIFF